MIKIILISGTKVHISKQTTKYYSINFSFDNEKAKAEGVSNCPYCAIGHDQNAHRIWKLDEMDADHVTAWSKGGSTTIENCQMLCKPHNRAKGNK